VGELGGQLDARRAGVRAQPEAEPSARPAGGGGAPGVSPQQSAGGGAELPSTRALTTCALEFQCLAEVVVASVEATRCIQMKRNFPFRCQGARSSRETCDSTTSELDSYPWPNWRAPSSNRPLKLAILPPRRRAAGKITLQEHGSVAVAAWITHRPLGKAAADT